MSSATPKCIVCNTSSQEVPLLSLQYRNAQFFICPQHFPILIHQPHKLIGVLPGAENFQAHSHEDEA
jgi:hypothetical protein